MTSLTDPQEEALSFAYDPEGNLTEAELPSGVTTTNSYDDAGRLSATTTTKGEAVLQSFEYGYDPAGNRISQVDRLSQETTFSYDALGRLTEFDPPDLLGELLPEPPIKYAYDDAGNRTSAGETTYSYNALNQLTESSDGTTYSYDGAGRLVEKGALLTTTYEWNALDELVGVDTGLQEVTYTYDALGRRAARSAPSGTQGAHYGDLTDVPILDTDSEGKATTSYVQGPQGLIEQRSGEATSFPLPDAHGDVTALLDAEGGVASRHSYDPWGVQLSGPSLEMGYLGAQQRRTDPATGLIQMGIRPYSPALASFIAEDPVLGHFGIGTSIDRYAYVWDNPLNLYDLDGRTASGLGATGLLGDAWDATGGKAWDATAGARTAAGVAGDGNGGWLNESPGFISDRIQDF